MPMTRLFRPRLLLAAVSLSAVLVLVWVDLGRTSPGPLTRAHARLPELATNDSCDRCHGEVGVALAAACGECHGGVVEDVTQARGFHGTLPEGDPNDCGHCHREHLGRGFPLVGERAFQLAGIADPGAFDHASLDFTLGGRHLELECAACHPHANAETVPEGEARFRGVNQACDSCHDDVHEGRIVVECASCHGQAEPFAEVVAFRHSASYQPVGKHAALGCLECHASATPHAVEALAGEGAPPRARECVDCHDAPHDPDFLAAGANAEAHRCTPCHQAEEESFRGHDAAMPRAAHEATGFSLAPPHAELACEQCHPIPEVVPADRFALRFPGRDASACSACHEDPHRGQFDENPLAEAGCVSCHARDSFHPSNFGLPRHERTAFPLDAAHQAVACGACHEAEPDPSPIYAAAPTECAACHEDAHRGAFAELTPRSGGSNAGCADCHEATLFREVDRDGFDHAHWTRFALEGAHARARCESCHPPAAEIDAAGRRFGFAAEHFGEPIEECATCHADPHGNGFVPAADRECARCHSTEAFGEVGGGLFDHGGVTGFALEGAHATASCATCHPALEQRDAAGRSFARASDVFGAPADRCATCHADAHHGAFDTRGPREVEGRADCARCHGPETFSPIRLDDFDHATWTGYPLSGVHAEVSCERCHPAREAPDARGRCHFFAAGRDCLDCHADPHVGQFAREGATDCARCHVPNGTVEFDHQTDSRFPLDERHRALDCAACHRSWPLAGGGTAVRYRPLGLECGDCHGTDFTPHGGRGR